MAIGLRPDRCLQEDELPGARLDSSSLAGQDERGGALREIRALASVRENALPGDDVEEGVVLRRVDLECVGPEAIAGKRKRRVD